MGLLEPMVVWDEVEWNWACNETHDGMTVRMTRQGQGSVFLCLQDTFLISGIVAGQMFGGVRNMI